MDQIGLPETIEAIRAELRTAVAQGDEEDLQFPIGGVQLEFQVGVTREASGEGRLNVWVLELGGSRGYTHESLQRVTLSLGAPVDAEGRPVRVHRLQADKP